MPCTRKPLQEAAWNAAACLSLASGVFLPDEFLYFFRVTDSACAYTAFRVLPPIQCCRHVKSKNRIRLGFAPRFCHEEDGVRTSSVVLQARVVG